LGSRIGRTAMPRTNVANGKRVHVGKKDAVCTMSRRPF
jgi:hypothetical protein